MDFNEFVLSLDMPDLTIRVGGAMQQLVDFETKLARGQRNSLFVAALAIMLILYFTLARPLVHRKSGSSNGSARFSITSNCDLQTWKNKPATPGKWGETRFDGPKPESRTKDGSRSGYPAGRARPLSDTLLCAFANGLPILMIFIVMGAAGIHLDMGTMMVASVAAGIAVDDTIHFFHHYKAQRNLGRNPDTAIIAAYERAGRAITLTTVILVAQFGILGFSDFAPSRNFGLLVAIGLASAWIFDMLVLPAAIVARDAPKRPNT